MRELNFNVGRSVVNYTPSEISAIIAKLNSPNLTSNAALRALLSISKNYIR